MEKLDGKEFTFKIRKIILEHSLSKGVFVNPERLSLQVYDDVIKGMLNIATMESPIYRQPDNWLFWLAVKWNRLKEKLPPRVRRWFRPRYTEIVAIHKFPEVGIMSTFGREFLHLVVMDYDKFVKGDYDTTREGKETVELSEMREVWRGGEPVD